MKDIDQLKHESTDDLRVARDRREEHQARENRDGPILDAFDRMSRGEDVPYTPGPRHTPKFATATATETRIYTARISYGGADRLDIARKSAGPAAIAFAPSWAILRPMIALRRAGGVVLGAWPQYVEDYTAEMRTSYRERRSAWDALLARDEVTLVCYCTDAAHCHRTVLAGILGKLGASVRGERLP